MTSVRTMKTEHLLFVSIIVLSFFLFIYGIGSISLFDVDEVSFAQAAREMLERKDYIVPFFNNQYRFDKPVLFYWVLILSYKIFGINEFSARLPSVISALLLLSIHYLFLKRFTDLKISLISIIMLITNLEFFIVAKAAITDMLLCFFTYSALYSFFTAMHMEGKKGNFYLYLASISLSFAVLTKGPVGVVLPSIIIFLYLVINGELNKFLTTSPIFKLFFVFLFLVIPWYIAIHLKTDGKFTEVFFLKHNIQRYTRAISGHGGPFYYYIPVILLGFFPWSIILFPSIINSLKKLLQKNDTKVKIDLHLFMLIIMATYIVFFSFAKTKLPHYILPIFPAMAAVCSEWIEKKDKKSKAVSVSLYTIAVILGLIFYLVFIIEKNPSIAGQKFSNFISEYRIHNVYIFLIFSLLFFLAFTTAGYLFSKKRTLEAFIVISIIMITFQVISIKTISYQIEEYIQGDKLRIAKACQFILKPRDQLYIYRDNLPSVLYYSGHPYIWVTSSNFDIIKEKASSGEPFFLITSKKNMKALIEKGINLTVLKMEGKYVILSNDNINKD